MIRYERKIKEQDMSTFNMALASLRIVFMGTPDFAVCSLEALVRSGCNVVGVITAPDKRAGRGMKFSESAVKKYALSIGLPLLQPEKLKSPDFLEALALLRADLQVVVAFRMLPEVVWNMPSKGTINVHASLLPDYRGAAPVNWAIINGEKKTGVTTFKLKQEIDTGNILLQESILIGDNETAGELHDRLKETGAKLLVQTLAQLAEGILHERPQSDDIDKKKEESKEKHAPKINAGTCRINWHKTTDEIYNLIRGLSPFPGAYTYLNDKSIKIFRSEKIKEGNAIKNVTVLDPGDYHTDHKTFLLFRCTDGFISIKELQLEGKRSMQIVEFLKGHSLKKKKD